MVEVERCFLCLCFRCEREMSSVFLCTVCDLQIERLRVKGQVAKATTYNYTETIEETHTYEQVTYPVNDYTTAKSALSSYYWG